MSLTQWAWIWQTLGDSGEQGQGVGKSWTWLSDWTIIPFKSHLICTLMKAREQIKLFIVIKVFLILHANFRVLFMDYLSLFVLLEEEEKQGSTTALPNWKQQLGFLAERQNCQQEDACMARLIPIVLLYCYNVVCLVLTVWNRQTQELWLNQQTMVKIVAYSNEWIQPQTLSSMWQKEKWQNLFPKMICKEFFLDWGILGFWMEVY